ncbi:MAG: GTPase HflX [Bdellovibrionales bacterium]|nr:GTPase HflX [Bdellovibrionales bacterium]
MSSSKPVQLERAIIVGCGLKSDSFSELKESMAELEELAYAAGAEVVGTAIQVLPKYVPATLIGSGKVEEIKTLLEETNATLVVIDHSLAGSQSRNLEELIGARVLDRAQLILDIFAQRAQTYEGKLQVELAQMMDQLPRMVGGWLGSHSRLGGGIGTRGPGETALEMDRRRIRKKMDLIKAKLEDVRRNRAQYRQSRKRSKVPSFALIGYTNTGKSTLLNRLTQSQVLVKDQVFATLDPTTRQVFLPEVNSAVVTDTVGFIRKLPTHLIEAFKATLEESGEADVLLHVIDLSSPSMEAQMKVVDNLIHEFKWESKPIIYVFNKVDKSHIEKQMRVKKFPRVFISALTGQGLDKLKKMMSEEVKKLSQEVELYFPKDKEFKIYELGKEAQISRTENAASGTVCYAFLTEGQLSKWKEFLQ